MNNRSWRILTLTLAISMLMAGAALAKDIVVFNETNFEIRAVYMSSAEDKWWGDNLLKGDVLRPGEGLKISVSGTPKDLDLALIDDEGQELALMELDFREFDSLTLFTDGTGRFD
ncbi:hypothetical protein [Maridesulfovibrio sp.]|uniref:hypothetical protein n=1 Tax=Maridesulfovibrio sp. TaxID=2795000 RepID=UPI0039F05354